MFLGLNKAVVKGHGNSKARAFTVCIEQAANAVRGDLVGKMKTLIDQVNLDQIAQPTATENGEQ